MKISRCVFVPIVAFAIAWGEPSSAQSPAQQGTLLVSGREIPTEKDVGRFLELVPESGRVLVVGCAEASFGNFFKAYSASSKGILSFARDLDAIGSRATSQSFDAVWICNSGIGGSVRLRQLMTFVHRGTIVGIGKELAKEVFRDPQIVPRRNETAMTTDQWSDPARLNLLFSSDAKGDPDPHDERLPITIFPASQLIVSGREIRCVGRSAVATLPAAEDRPVREIELNAKPVDLVGLQRSLRDRRFGQRLLSKTRRVNLGTLMLVGGGKIPDGMLKQFIELAGGSDSRIVVFPTAAADPIPDRLWIVDALKIAGAKTVSVLRDRDRDAVDSSNYVETIQRATGIWFGGGRQWRFVDAFEGTKALGAMRGVLERGGVVGGSSAGASIQGDYLARGNPRGNWNIMAEGYERGFAFLPGTAVDQHFTQRNRLPELQSLVKRKPEVLGIGLDESTAIIVRRSKAQVIGEGAAYFVSAELPSEKSDRNSEKEATPFVRVRSGQTFDVDELSTLR